MPLIAGRFRRCSRVAAARSSCSIDRSASLVYLTIISSSPRARAGGTRSIAMHAKDVHNYTRQCSGIGIVNEDAQIE